MQRPPLLQASSVIIAWETIGCPTARRILTTLASLPIEKHAVLLLVSLLEDVVEEGVDAAVAAAEGDVVVAAVEEVVLDTLEENSPPPTRMRQRALSMERHTLRARNVAGIGALPRTPPAPVACRCRRDTPHRTPWSLL